MLLIFQSVEVILRKRFWWPQTRSTGVHCSVWGCVLLHTSCGAAFSIISSTAVSALIALFNFNRLGYTTYSQTFQLCLMKMHSDTHSGLSIPLALVLPYYFFIILLKRNVSSLDMWNAVYVEDNLPSLQGLSSVSSLCVPHFTCLPPIRKSSETFGSWRAECFISCDVTASAEE